LGKALRASPGPAHYIFAFVFLVRIIALARLSSSPLLLPSSGDMHFYDEWARQILQGRLTDGVAFYGLPLYAYLLALLYKLFGFSPFVPGFLQACLDAGTATLLYKISLRIFRDNGDIGPFRAQAIGLLAALGWAFFVPAQAYAAILMPTTWAVFIFWFVVWQIIKNDEAPSPLRCLACGALIGLAATGVATILFLLPLLIAAVILKSPLNSKTLPPWKARALGAALLFLGVGAGTSPCWIHNYFVARDPVFLSAHSGVNFWLGNNPDATGYPRFPGMRAGQAEMLRDSIDLAQAAAGKELKRSEVSRYWSAKARAYIAGNFGAWLRLMCRKVANFWNAFEYDDLNVIANLRAHGIALPGPHWGIIAAIAIPGLFFSLRARPAAGWIAAAILLQMFAVLPVFITERYRLAAVPGLLLFAAAGLEMLWRNCSTGRYRAVAIHAGVLFAAAIFVTWPRNDSSLWAMEFYNSGRQALEANDLPLAEKDLTRAHELVPENAETNFALGNLRWAQGRFAEARTSYQAALKADPRHKSALNNLGMLALQEKDWEVAVKFFRASLQVAPGDAKSHYLLARAEFALGHKNEAAAEIQIALQLNPDQPEFIKFQETMRGRP
jgi:tetratricopeptide (TPR) repeat protein